MAALALPAAPALAQEDCESGASDDDDSACDPTDEERRGCESRGGGVVFALALVPLGLGLRRSSG